MKREGTSEITHLGLTSALALAGKATGPKGVPSGLPGVLAHVGYTTENLMKVGVLPSSGLAIGDPLPLWELLVRASGDGALEVLVRLFMLGQVESREAVTRALSPKDGPKVSVEQLEAAGLVIAIEIPGKIKAKADSAIKANAGVRALAGLVPLGEQLVLRDFPRAITGQAPARDYVLAVGGASVLVAQLTPRAKAELALDLGTGQGFQAMQAAAHVKRVIATDVNHRALQLAATSCALSGITNVEFRFGSLYEPVAAEAGEFDLIVSNPPFVIAPPQDVIGYSDQSLSGHALVERVVRGAGKMLRAGGVCVLVANWAYAGDEARDRRWAATPRRWLEHESDTPCDAAIVHFGSYPARTYAFKWLEETGTPRSEISAERMARWMEYYETIGLEAVAFGALVLKRCSPGQTPIVHAESLDTPPKGHACGDVLLRTLAGVREVQTRLAISPETLGAWKPTLTKDAVLQRELVVGKGTWLATDIALTQRGGIPRRAMIDAVTADLLALLDGSRTVDDAGRRVARQHGVEGSGADAMARAREVVGGLAKLGYFEA